MTERPGVEPSITYSEVEAAGLVLRDRRFVDGLRARGITDLTKLFCAPFAAGYYAIPAHEGKRLIRVGCFDTRRSTTNVFAWPIERLYGLVDLRRREVIEVTDGGVVPIAPGDLNYGEAAVGALACPAQADAAGAAAGLERPAGRAHGDVGPVALPRPRSIRASAR